MSKPEVKHASYLQAGVMRCCVAVVPGDSDGKVVAGSKDGERIACESCQDRDNHRSGMVYRESDNVWLAAWIYDKQA